MLHLMKMKQITIQCISHMVSLMIYIITAEIFREPVDIMLMSLYFST